MNLIDLRNKDFKELEAFLAKRKKDGGDVTETVKNIIRDVENNGDAALIKYTEKFDGFKFESKESIKVSRQEIEQAYKEIDNELAEIIKRAAKNIEDFHQKQSAQSFIYEKEPGIKLGTLRKPLKTAGIYVPAGTAPLPSSVLMNAIPAKVAGVKNIIMATPPGRGTDKINPAILVAADIAGITEIYKIGGAQAIAALAYGTETIPKADKITGPGNIYVATAKKLIYGECDIDMIAGPSEILIIADKTARPDYVAADLLSQAEHDKLASSILITTEEDLINKVENELTAQIASLPRKAIAESSLENYGAIILVKDMNQAIDAANIIAPEHLELCIENAEGYAEEIENAGAIFIGNYTPEPLGDYYAGPNHVLPTTGTAKFYSPLNVWDFIKQTNIISYSKEALLKNADDIIRFAQAEELDGHARSISIRKGGQGDGSPVLSERRTGEPSPCPFFSNKLAELKPYVPGEQPKDGEYIKLNTNENPYPPSKKVIEAINGATGNLRLYPDPESTELKSTYADYTGVKPENVFVGNGSDEVLSIAFQAFFMGKRDILMPDITYSFYPVYCVLYDVGYEEVPVRDDFTIDCDMYLRPNNGVVIANPNAPTSIALGPEEIERIVKGNRDRVVLIDEAYVDFGGESAGLLTKKYNNLLVVSTLSKSRSLAGLRVGFAVGDKDLIKAMDTVKNSINSYPVDLLAQKGAKAAISDREYFDETRAKIIKTREWTRGELLKLGFNVLPSTANFLFVESKEKRAGDIFQELKREKILVRHFNKPGIDNYLRVSIGTDSDMKKFIEVISKIMIK